MARRTSEHGASLRDAVHRWFDLMEDFQRDPRPAVRRRMIVALRDIELILQQIRVELERPRRDP